MTPNYEPAIRAAAVRLAPNRYQLDSRGLDRADFEQELRIKAWQAQQASKRDVQKPIAYTHRAIRNAEVSFGRKRTVGEQHYSAWTDYDKDDEGDFERAQMFRQAITRLGEAFTKQEMRRLQNLMMERTRAVRSRTTDYRYNVALLKRVRDFLEAEGVDPQVLDITIEEEQAQEIAVFAKLSLAQSGRNVLIPRVHQTCARFSQPAPVVRTVEDVPGCGTLAGVAMMRLEDGSVIELLDQGRADQAVARTSKRRKRQRVFWARGEANEHSSASLQGLYAAPSSNQGGGFLGGNGSDGTGGDSGDGSGSGPTNQAINGFCIACEGTGKASNGKRCKTCKGTGSRAASGRKQIPVHQHPELSGTDDRQRDLFAPKTDDLDSVGGAHVHAPVDEGGAAESEDRGLDAGDEQDGGVEGDAVQGDAPSGVLPGDADDADVGAAAPSGDGVQSGLAHHGGSDVQGPTEGREASAQGEGPPHVELQRPEVLPPVAVEKAVPREPGVGYVVDLSTLTFTRVDWKNVVPLMRTREGYDVFQLTYWSGKRNAWVWFVARHTDRKMPDGVVEVTPEEWLAFDKPAQGFLVEGEWKNGEPPLLVTDKGRNIHQVTYWEGSIGKWIVVTHNPLKRGLAGAIEMSADEWFQVLRQRAEGVHPANAFRGFVG